MDIASAISSFKTLADITALTISLSTDSRVTEKAVKFQSEIISLQNDLLAIQAQHQTLLHEKEKLEQQLIEIQNWKAEAQKYTLIQAIPGVFAYALKADYKDTTPMHWLCPNCYESNKKSILQRQHSKATHRAIVVCPYPSCRLELDTQGALPQ